MGTHGYPGRPSCDEIGLPDFSPTVARIRLWPLPTYLAQLGQSNDTHMVLVPTMGTHGYPGRPSCDELGLPDFSPTVARIRLTTTNIPAQRGESNVPKVLFRRWGPTATRGPPVVMK